MAWHRRRDRRPGTSRCHRPKGHPRNDPADLQLPERHPRAGPYQPACGSPQLFRRHHIDQEHRRQSARSDRPDEHMARALRLLRLKTLQNASGGGRFTSGRCRGGTGTSGRSGGRWNGRPLRISCESYIDQAHRNAGGREGDFRVEEAHQQGRPNHTNDVDGRPSAIATEGPGAGGGQSQRRGSLGWSSYKVPRPPAGRPPSSARHRQDSLPTMAVSRHADVGKASGSMMA